MGVITAAVGGIIRDVLGQERSIILRREIYVTASLLGAIAFTTLTATGMDRLPAGAMGDLLCSWSEGSPFHSVGRFRPIGQGQAGRCEYQ